MRKLFGYVSIRPTRQTNNCILADRGRVTEGHHRLSEIDFHSFSGVEAWGCQRISVAPSKIDSEIEIHGILLPRACAAPGLYRSSSSNAEFTTLRAARLGYVLPL